MSTPAVYAEFDVLHAGPRAARARDPRRAARRAALRRRPRARRCARQRPAAGLAAAAARRSPSPCRRASSHGATPPWSPAPGPTCLFLCGDADHAARWRPRWRRTAALTVCHGPVPGATVVDGASDGEPGQPGAGLEVLRRPAAAHRGLPRHLGRGADRHRRPQRRRQDHAARDHVRPRGARHRPGLARPRAAHRLPPPGRRARRLPHRPRGGARRQGRPRVGRRPGDPRGRRGAARRGRRWTAR